MVDREVIVAKAGALKRHLERLRGIGRMKRHIYLENLDAQDIAVHNLQMAIQKCIDIGNHFFSEWDIGAPASYAEVFDEMRRRKIITRAMTDRMIKMAGLRNRIVHEYEEIDHGKIFSFIKHDLRDFEVFLKAVARHL